MAKTRILWTLGFVSFIVGFIAVALSAQAQRSIASLDELLTEVRRLSSASIRTQLLTARLQLQEQRVYTASRQVTDVQTELAALRGAIRQSQLFINRSD